jgi:hypothetical protein
MSRNHRLVALVLALGTAMTMLLAFVVSEAGARYVLTDLKGQELPLLTRVVLPLVSKLDDVLFLASPLFPFLALGVLLKRCSDLSVHIGVQLILVLAALTVLLLTAWSCHLPYSFLCG